MVVPFLGVPVAFSRIVSFRVRYLSTNFHKVQTLYAVIIHID